MCGVPVLFNNLNFNETVEVQISRDGNDSNLQTPLLSYNEV